MMVKGLITELKRDYTIVTDTHSMQQATWSRPAPKKACSAARPSRTQDYISGRVG